MPRFKLTIEYDGTPFAGWQEQDGSPTVQSRLAAAIQGFSGESVTVFGAGRTDAGVHATGQVAHIDLARVWPEGTVRDAMNDHLRPDPVAIVEAEEVPDSFDARLSAIRRHYRYRMVNRRAPLALDYNRAWRVGVPLNAELMHEAAQALLGRNDFTTFRSVNCQATSPVKTLDEIAVHRTGEDIELTTCARSFMHRQVRSIVGSLKLVGEGKWPVGAIAEALAVCDRAACGAVAPAHGLYLARVDYEPAFPI